MTNNDFLKKRMMKSKSRVSKNVNEDIELNSSIYPLNKEQWESAVPILKNIRLLFESMGKKETGGE